MILLGISGKRGAGKDLLASYFVNKYGFLKVSFAEELKRQVREHFNLTTEHTDGALKEVMLADYLKGKYHDSMGNLVIEYWTPRDIMVAYGQFFRQFDRDWWIKQAFKKIEGFEVMAERGVATNYARFVISDLRFKNEAEAIKEKGGIVVRLERKPELNIYKGALTDVSETDLDDYDFDLTLGKDANIGPEDLEKFADTIMDAYGSLKGV